MGRLFKVNKILSYGKLRRIQLKYLPLKVFHSFSDDSFLRINLSLTQLSELANSISQSLEVTGAHEVAWALKALTLTDLTTLAGDDTAANVRRLCVRAILPFEPKFLENSLEPSLLPEIHCAAVCVYPARVADAYKTLKQYGKLNDINIAAVATGFPTGQYGLNSRLQEINDAIQAGATEIDIVINRQLALIGDWEGVYKEVVLMREACGKRAHLKTILAIGELGSMENVSTLNYDKLILMTKYLFRFIRLLWSACWRAQTSLRPPPARRQLMPRCP